MEEITKRIKILEKIAKEEINRENYKTAQTIINDIINITKEFRTIKIRKNNKKTN